MKTYDIKIEHKNGIVMEYTNYYLISSLTEYKEYLTELNNKFIISEKEIKELDTFIGHAHSKLTGITSIYNSGNLAENKKDRKQI